MIDDDECVLSNGSDVVMTSTRSRGVIMKCDSGGRSRGSASVASDSQPAQSRKSTS